MHTSQSYVHLSGHLADEIPGMPLAELFPIGVLPGSLTRTSPGCWRDVLVPSTRRTAKQQKEPSILIAHRKGLPRSATRCRTEPLEPWGPL